MKPTLSAISANKIISFILPVRQQRVILDADLAKIYGVESRALNQAVKRNPGRFPRDFMFQLTRDEAMDALRSRSQIVILKPQRGHNLKYLPFVFSEHGALMAATVLNSPKAVKMSLFIIRAFIKMREGVAANETILKRLAEIDKALLTHDEALRDIYEEIRPLLAPPPDPPKPEIGFHIKEESPPYRVKSKAKRPGIQTR